MRPRRESDRVQRRSRFERFEERLVLSAQPWVGALLGGGIEHHYGELSPVEPVVPVAGAGDFSLDGQLPQQVQPHLGDVAPHLGDVHDMTGVSYVHNTFGFDGAGQTVAVVDSGVAYDHYALGAGFGSGYRVVGGYDFAENDADPYDDGPSGFHGTHVAGIVGSNNGTYRGVASAADLVALRVFNDQGDGFFSWVESALQWVHDHRHDFANPITTVNLSLGTTWNSDSVPGWAMLEDEFAQLKADGIFISVSAGNDFQDYNTTGVSYPAASPHVVPVASVDNSGSLSYFSQRNSRVLAAPGRSITSTVPDYLFGGDGVPNDFGTASGTSMAAPYVAGASALVRQAMDFVGYSGITQDTIYDHLRSTADTFFDAATSANYHRINLQSALDALMPADDYGSSAATAHDLGTLVGESSLSGLIGTLEDQDYFTFTAGATGTISFSAAVTHALQLDAELVGGGGSFQDGTLSFDVAAGQTYTVRFGTAAGIGYYDLDMELEPAMTDWGQVEYQQRLGETLSGSENWFQFTATRGGTLTVEASFSHAAGDVNLQLYDPNMQLLDASHSATGVERVDAQVVAGQTYYLSTSGGNAAVDFRLANLVSRSGARLDVFGTAGNDSIVFDAQALSVSINDVLYSGSDLTGVSTIGVAAGDGQDTFTYRGSAANETARLRVGSASVSGGAQAVSVTAAETVQFDGDAGTDLVYFYDSSGDDTFHGRPHSARMEGPGFNHLAANVEQTYAYATAGGSGDRAYFYDSPGNDRFIGRPDWGMMDGSGFYIYARQFEWVYAYATAGGDADRAYFYDSAGNDRFIGHPDWALMDGSDYYFYARQFEQVYAYATAGGDADRAYFYDSPGDDRFIGRPDWALMDGPGFYNYARKFEQVYAYATAGGAGDSAYLYDSPGDDRFIGRPDWALLDGPGFYNYARQFEWVYAYATAGGANDSAYLYDSAGDDRFIGHPDWVLMDSSAYYFYARQFDWVYAYATAGGNDTAHFYDSAGDDRFISRADWSLMDGYGFYNYARKFENVYAYSQSGGQNDRAYFYDSAGDDQLTVGRNWARMSGSGFNNYARNFDRVYAYATAGGYDLAVFEDVAFGENVFGRQNYGVLNRSGPVFEAYGFDALTAIAKNDENPNADVQAVDYLFSQIGSWN